MLLAHLVSPMESSSSRCDREPGDKEFLNPSIWVLFNLSAPWFLAGTNSKTDESKSIQTSKNENETDLLSNTTVAKSHIKTDECGLKSISWRRVEAEIRERLRYY